ncbi:cupin-like domain-containing protein [Duganella sp. FT92W]|uniref:Cupin-like domain-containing protein n=1 Tax=Pseudoduganella rivuli TaxID=2666085 RepID=A0A7X2ILV6_9BURK|nr:cupin-like domain-containing protein [Pseudoduganella rivuli]MRV72417.1 cupin-like domain-containing protein [Pseudoduganella rivuli]
MKRQTNVQPLGISDEWRRWIAENLMLGSHPDTLAGILVQSGVGLRDAQAELAAALASPYLQGVQRLHNRLAKRDWLLGIQAQLNRLAPMEIPRRHQLSGEDFLHQHYIANRPVILTGWLDDVSRDDWSLERLAQRFGDRTVEVQFGRNADPDYEMNSIAHKRTMRFSEYTGLVAASGHTNDFYMTANNGQQNRHALRELWDDVPKLPHYLADEPAGFFWLGPAGTVTPFHHDLTNNFMIQLSGRKRVRLIAPCETPKLYNQRHCFTPVDGRAIDTQRFPAMAGVPVPECVLEPGEVLFLPVGWWHFVEALDISITVSATHFKWDNDFYSNYPTNHDF